MSLKSDIQGVLNTEWRFRIPADEEEIWKREYRKIGRRYATWGAIFAVFGAPMHMLNELSRDYEDPQTWLFMRLFPSALIAISFILFRRYKFSHEIMFLIIAYSLFVDFAYWPDCADTELFLYGQLTMLIPAAIITLLRPFFFVINIIVQFVIILILYNYFCDEPPVTFFSSKEFIPILIASISSYIVASFRYFLVKRNFIFNMLLKEALDEAEAGRQKSDELLKNILPEEVAEELKEKGNSAARNFDFVSILFTDFINFTELSASMSAEELVSEIDESFKAMDSICEKYQIEKIKTIGDSYMAAGGLPVPTPDSVRNTVMAALEMQEFIGKRFQTKDERDEPAFSMRVGVHSGPVVAGIVGVKKFQYDIWGDTVNTASRMESNGQKGKVNISQATYDFIKDDPAFSFESRGKVDVKGKGEMDMWFVSLSSTM